MDKNELVDALEKVNMDYINAINSKEYILGKRLYEIRKIFKKNGLKRILRYLRYIRNRKVESQDTFYNKGGYLPDDLKCVVYTCITGQYDSIKDPVYISPNTDYIVFSDDKIEKNSSIWIYKPVDYKGKNANRFYKLHPFYVLEKCDYSVYIDGRVQVVSDIKTVLSIAQRSRTGLAMHYHSSRKDIYDEAQSCISLKKGNRENIIKQMQNYVEQGFPHNFGLYEATVIVVDHSNPVAKQILDSWWSEFTKYDSGRDQLALPYCVWKMGYEFSDIGCLGNCKELNPKFRMLSHNV